MGRGKVCGYSVMSLLSTNHVGPKGGGRSRLVHACSRCSPPKGGSYRPGPLNFVMSIP